MNDRLPLKGKAFSLLPTTSGQVQRGRAMSKSLIKALPLSEP
jgi:hypothetical protein